MRVAGYIRQIPGTEQADTAFAQSERIRRWVRDTGNELVATCQDEGFAAATADRTGYRALLDIVRSSSTDAVVIANLEALSSDKMLQEIMLADLRSSGVTVIATDEADIEALRDAADDPARIVVRDVVAKVAEYREAFGLAGDAGTAASRSTPVRDATDVVVELIAKPGA